MKNFTLEFADHQWIMYTENKNKYGSEIDNYFKLPDLAYLEDEYTSINAYWDSDEQAGYIDVEITAPKTENTYTMNEKYHEFGTFIKDLKNLKNKIEIEKLNITAWEYEKSHPYTSRGLSMRDFI